MPRTYIERGILKNIIFKDRISRTVGASLVPFCGIPFRGIARRGDSECNVWPIKVSFVTSYRWEKKGTARRKAREQRQIEEQIALARPRLLVGRRMIGFACIWTANFETCGARNSLHKLRVLIGIYERRAQARARCGPF